MSDAIDERGVGQSDQDEKKAFIHTPQSDTKAPTLNPVNPDATGSLKDAVKQFNPEDDPRYKNWRTMATASKVVDTMQRVSHMDDQSIIHQTINAVDEDQTDDKPTSPAYTDYGSKDLTVRDLMDEYDVENLSLLELVTLRKKMYQDLSDLRSCEEMIAAVEALIPEDQVDIDTAQKTMSANYLDQFGFNDFDLDTFRKFVNSYKPGLSQFVIDLDGRIKELQKNGVSSKILSENMIEIMNKRISKLSKDDLDYELKKQRYITVINAYKQRIESRFEILNVVAKEMAKISSNRRTLKKAKDAIKRGKCAEDLLRLYGFDTIAKLGVVVEQLSYVEEGHNYDADVKLYIPLLYTLNRMAGKSLQSKVMVDIFIFNIVDYFSGTFDLDEPQSYFLMIQKTLGFQLHCLLKALFGDVNKQNATDINLSLYNLINELNDRYAVLNLADDEKESSDEPTEDKPIEEVINDLLEAESSEGTPSEEEQASEEEAPEPEQNTPEQE